MNSPYPEHKKRRLADWDYSWNGAYFVTFCTSDREPLLGVIEQVKDGPEDHTVFHPSQLGEVCSEAIEQLKEADEPFVIDSYVVMPNHVHLLVFVQSEGKSEAAEKDKRIQLVQRIVARVKGPVFQAARREIGMSRVWQRSFHDHIVRSEEDLARIREYIANNPQKWAIDRFYQE